MACINYVCMYVCVYVHIHVHIYIYIHTHTHTHIYGLHTIFSCVDSVRDVYFTYIFSDFDLRVTCVSCNAYVTSLSSPHTHTLCLSVSLSLYIYIYIYLTHTHTCNHREIARVCVGEKQERERKRVTE